MGEPASYRPVHNDYFMPVGQSAPARHPFSGTVTVGARSLAGASHRCPGLAIATPGFTAAFFTHGEHLVPAARNILRILRSSTPGPIHHEIYGSLKDPLEF